MLIEEQENYSLGGDFRVSRHAEIFQFDCFSSEINLKKARNCDYGIPILGSRVKMKILYFHHYKLISSQLWLTTHLRSTVAPLGTETPGTSRAFTVMHGKSITAEK